ncbi:MAG: glycosyltransferase family 9 protein [Syntrophales bacterium]
MKTILKSFYLSIRGSILKALRLLFTKKKSLLSLLNIQSILFIRVDRVGDMVLSTPAFRAIKAALPRVRLTVMATPVNAAILMNNPDVDDVVVYDRCAGLHDKMKLMMKLRSRQFSLAVDPHNDYELKTAFLAALSGAAIRIGYGAFGREIFFNQPASLIKENTHFVDVALDLLKDIGISATNRIPEINLSDDEQVWAKKWLADNGLEGNTVVGIHPGAHYKTQRWLPEYYAELIQMIRCQPQTGIILFGGPSDAKVIEEIITRVRTDICVSIQNNLRYLSALLAQCQIFICNNSGPLHIASALNIPTISFMGPTVQEQWTPLGAIHRVLRRDDLPCIGCNLGYCKIKSHDCMRLITPYEVAEMIFKDI